MMAEAEVVVEVSIDLTRRQISKKCSMRTKVLVRQMCQFQILTEAVNLLYLIKAETLPQSGVPPKKVGLKFLLILDK